jgi:hypothetical protein
LLRSTKMTEQNSKPLQENGQENMLCDWSKLIRQYFNLEVYNACKI